jgi:hypothetical protein
MNEDCMYKAKIAAIWFAVGCILIALAMIGWAAGQ